MTGGEAELQEGRGNDKRGGGGVGGEGSDRRVRGSYTKGGGVTEVEGE